MNAQTYRNHFTNTDDNGWHFPFFSFLLYYFLLLVIYLLFRNVRPPGKSQPTIVNSIAEIVVRLTQPKCIVHVEIFSFWHSYKRDESIRMSHDFQEIHGILCRFMFNLHLLKSFLCCDVILFFNPIARIFLTLSFIQPFAITIYMARNSGTETTPEKNPKCQKITFELMKCNEIWFSSFIPHFEYFRNFLILLSTNSSQFVCVCGWAPKRSFFLPFYSFFEWFSIKILIGKISLKHELNVPVDSFT